MQGDDNGSRNVRVSEARLVLKGYPCIARGQTRIVERRDVGIATQRIGCEFGWGGGGKAEPDGGATRTGLHPPQASSASSLLQRFGFDGVNNLPIPTISSRSVMQPSALQFRAVQNFLQLDQTISIISTVDIFKQQRDLI